MVPSREGFLDQLTFRIRRAGGALLVLLLVVICQRPDEMILGVNGQAVPSTGLAWVKMGGPVGGIGYDIRMRPGNPDIMYVTDTFSGVNMSTDGGRTWVASNEGITARSGPSGDWIPVFCLTIDPSNPDIVWCGTKDQRGIFKSTDGGRTWASKSRGVVENQGISFRGIAVHPKDSRVVYAAAEISSFAWAPDHKEHWGRSGDSVKGVVYKSVDGGENWTAVWRGENLARYVLIDPRRPETVYVSTGIFDRDAANSDPTSFSWEKPGFGNAGGVGILKSTDGGQTWKVLGKSNGLKNLYISSLFMAPQDPDALLAAAGNRGWQDGSGVYRSADGGESWTKVMSEASFTPFGSVEIATSNPAIAYAGTQSRIYRSEDGGVTWKPMTEEAESYGAPGTRAGVPIDFQVDPRDPNRLFANNYLGGNFLSEDGGRTWAVASQGYTGAQLRGVVVDSTDANKVYVVGRSGPFVSTTGGKSWAGLTHEIPLECEWFGLGYDSHTGVLLIAASWMAPLYRADDGGRTWQFVHNIPEAAQTVPRQGITNECGFKALAFASSNPSIAYAGECQGDGSLDQGIHAVGFGVHRSEDGGKTWHTANDAKMATLNVHVLRVDPHNADIVYAGTLEQGVLKSTNGGYSWAYAREGLATKSVRALAIDPLDPQILYAGADKGGIYKTIDGGARWTRCAQGMLPEPEIQSIVTDPVRPGTLYAGDMRMGVFVSEDAGRTWRSFSNGLRTRSVMSLAISADGSVLYAATDGEGLFRMDLNPR